jgi:hypothetical protein
MQGKDISVVLADEAVQVTREASEFDSLEELKQHIVEDLLPQNSKQVRKRYAAILAKRLFVDDPYYEESSENPLNTPLVECADSLSNLSLRFAIFYHYALSNKVLSTVLEDFFAPKLDDFDYMTESELNAFFRDQEIGNEERTTKDILRCLTQFDLIEKSEEDDKKYLRTGNHSLSAFIYSLHHELGEPRMYFVEDIRDSLTRRAGLLDDETLQELIYDAWNADVWEYSFISDMEQVKLRHSPDEISSELARLSESDADTGNTHVSSR